MKTIIILVQPTQGVFGTIAKSSQSLSAKITISQEEINAA